jgi:hypothetical protein
MTDRQRGSRPEHNPTDARVAKLRDRAMDLLADATVHVQRLEEIGERMGLKPDLADGVGDQLYTAIVAQLDLAATVVERSHVAAERLLQLGADRWRNEPRYIRVDVPRDGKKRIEFTVRNASIRTATVDVSLRFAPKDAVGAPRIGAKTLQAGRTTTVQITIDGSMLKSETYAGEIRVALVHAGGQRLELPCRFFEVWVEPK